MKSCVTISLVTEARGGPFVYWDNLREACQSARRLGFDAVEIFANPDTLARAEDLPSLLADNNMQLAAVGTGAGWVQHQLHMALNDPVLRRAACDFVRLTIDRAAPYGASVIVGSMQGKSGHDVDRKSARGYLTENLSLLGEYAAGAGVTLLYEPLNRYETDQANTVEQGVALLQSLQTQNVRLLCDLFHMNIEETDIAAALRTGGAYIGHVHYVDSNRRPAGNGHLDFAPIVEALRDIDYQGYLSAEALPYPDPQGAAAQTIAHYRQHVGGAR